MDVPRAGEPGGLNTNLRGEAWGSTNLGGPAVPGVWGPVANFAFDFREAEGGGGCLAPTPCGPPCHTTTAAERRVVCLVPVPYPPHPTPHPPATVWGSRWPRDDREGFLESGLTQLPIRVIMSGLSARKSLSCQG